MIDFSQSPEVVAPLLLGSTLTFEGVSLRITEVEAYLGAEDEASHAHPGRTARNKAMFGPPAHMYIYRSYGIHIVGNIVCWPAEIPGAVLLRAGEITNGTTIALRRRGNVHPHHKLAQGPGNLGKALGLKIEHNHEFVHQTFGGIAPDGCFTLTPAKEQPAYATGPRIGISKNTDPHWRYWIPEDKTVSKWRGMNAHTK